MAQRNSQCLNLGGCLGFGPSVAENVKKQETPVMLDSGRLLVSSAEFASFPAPISHLVGDYVSDSDREHVEIAFAGVQAITLCLSQDIKSQLPSCWSIGFLPPNRPWEPSDVKIDKEYRIQDYEGCLQLLKQEDSNYCRVVIEVLVVKLSNTLNDFPIVLNDLRKTMEELKGHLRSVKHVVISINECASCCFTLEGVFDMVTGKRQPVDHVNALFKIINDLDSCWNGNHSLTVQDLFSFYIKSKFMPASETHLAKFVIPLNTNINLDLFDREASKTLSTKIMWVHNIETPDDLKYLSLKTSGRCHAIRVDASKVGDNLLLLNSLNQAFSLKDNHFIERIAMDVGTINFDIKLFRPSVPLTNPTPRSALIELTLKCKRNSHFLLDLTQLNNGYFPHLARLSVINGQVEGRLDSHKVPCLKTLMLELGHPDSKSRSRIYSLIHELTRSLIDTGRPWQVAAALWPGGWSLASYDNSIANPQEDGKEDAPPSPLIIRELMLVMDRAEHADEFQTLLNGNIYLEPADADQNEGLLEWVPECVEKINAFCTALLEIGLEFKKEIRGQTSILASLMCHRVDVALRGNVLPRLRSLELTDSSVMLSGSFPQLQTLSFKESHLQSPWEVDAPLLQSLDCQNVYYSQNLSLCPLLLPYLSYLRIELYENFPDQFPNILVDQGSLGLSHVNHVVFGKEMTKAPSFNLCQVHHVSHLELAVDVFQFPACWSSTEWRCETLTIHFYRGEPFLLYERKNPDANVPPLLSFVNKLTVTEKDCWVLLDSEIPELIDCTVPSLESLGPNLKCPKLKWICFTGKLSESDKEKCLNLATYKAVGAQASVIWVYFDNESELKRVS